MGTYISGLSDCCFAQRYRYGHEDTSRLLTLRFDLIFYCITTTAASTKQSWYDGMMDEPRL
jgi:hypothetical protein